MPPSWQSRFRGNAAILRGCAAFMAKPPSCRRRLRGDAALVANALSWLFRLCGNAAFAAMPSSAVATPPSRRRKLHGEGAVKHFRPRKTYVTIIGMNAVKGDYSQDGIAKTEKGYPAFFLRGDAAIRRGDAAFMAKPPSCRRSRRGNAAFVAKAPSWLFRLLGDVVLLRPRAFQLAIFLNFFIRRNSLIIRPSHYGCVRKGERGARLRIMCELHAAHEEAPRRRRP